MPRRVTPSQLRSELRRLEQQQRQALNKVNQAVDTYNREARRVNAHNKQVVDKFNRAVNTHNARVRANQQRRRQEVARLNVRTTASNRSVRYVTHRTSVQTLQRSFSRIEEASEQSTWDPGNELFDMAEGEAANSAAVLNVLLDEPTTEVEDTARLRDTIITSELRDISDDLHDRWEGALFALSPMNPDAARQFCTSAREILVTILELKAPDAAVLAVNPDITLTEYNKVPRREKIRYCLAQSGQQSAEFVDFVDDDINNVMDLFGTFNPATHGEAGRYDLIQLGAIKMRVEGAILFLHRIVS